MKQLETRGNIKLYAAILAVVLLCCLLALAAQSRFKGGQPVSRNQLEGTLEQYLESQTPGLQYLVVDAQKTLYAYAGGWADLARHRPMTLQTTLMAYSMTKTFTAVAVLQLVERGRLGLDDPVDRYLSSLPDFPYNAQGLTIRQLIAHTAGVPNPIPIRWAHLVEEDAGFDETAALAQVLRENPRLNSKPGQQYLYSNIGYWLLGRIVEQVTGQPFTEYVKANLIAPLAQPLAFVIPDPAHHANGYLARFSLFNLIKGFLMDTKFFGGYEGRWLRLKSHHLNGPAFGGMVGTAPAFAAFLQDQLRPQSVLLGAEGKRLLETQQRISDGDPIPMTLGWHVGRANGVRYFFKEGGGGGFHTEMRLYPDQGIASVVMVNATEFDSSQFLNRLDAVFLELR
jgi:D-alanyl-D-alanine carboxypeptidase